MIKRNNFPIEGHLPSAAAYTNKIEHENGKTKKKINYN